MNMNRLLGLCVFSILLVGCGDKDEAYYYKHIDKAHEKIRNCDSDLTSAFKEKDIDVIEKISKDLECQAAYNAVSKF